MQPEEHYCQKYYRSSNANQTKTLSDQKYPTPFAVLLENKQPETSSFEFGVIGVIAACAASQKKKKKHQDRMQAFITTWQATCEGKPVSAADCRAVLDVNQCVMRATCSEQRNTGGICSPAPETH